MLTLNPSQIVSEFMSQPKDGEKQMALVKYLQFLHKNILENIFLPLGQYLPPEGQLPIMVYKIKTQIDSSLSLDNFTLEQITALFLEFYEDLRTLHNNNQSNLSDDEFGQIILALQSLGAALGEIKQQRDLLAKAKNNIFPQATVSLLNLELPPLPNLQTHPHARDLFFQQIAWADKVSDAFNKFTKTQKPDPEHQELLSERQFLVFKAESLNQNAIIVEKINDLMLSLSRAFEAIPKTSKKNDAMAESLTRKQAELQDAKDILKQGLGAVSTTSLLRIQQTCVSCQRFARSFAFAEHNNKDFAQTQCAQIVAESQQLSDINELLIVKLDVENLIQDLYAMRQHHEHVPAAIINFTLQMHAVLTQNKAAGDIVRDFKVLLEENAQTIVQQTLPTFKHRMRSILHVLSLGRLYKDHQTHMQFFKKVGSTVETHSTRLKLLGQEHSDKQNARFAAPGRIKPGNSGRSRLH